MDTSTILQEVSKSVDQWCTQMSIANVKVPVFSACADVFEFIGEYEDATTTVNDEQRIRLLNKAFPRGCHRSWYENVIKPMAKSGKQWPEIKAKITDRFSTHGDQDRHMARLRQLKYELEGDKALQDFIDDMEYSYGRAYKSNLDVESCVRYIKASLPPRLQSSLAVYPDYRDAKDIETLKKAAKQYDNAKANGANENSGNKGTAEVGLIMKELMQTLKKEFENNRKDNEAMRQENAATKKALIAAMESNYLQWARRGSERGRSPNRRNSPSRVGFERGQSPRRSQSPRSYGAKPIDKTTDAPRSQGEHPRASDGNDNKEVRREAVNPAAYFERFGMPPSPCPECKDGSWHWIRHCYRSLN